MTPPEQPPPPPSFRRNFWLNTSNGSLASMGGSFFAAETVLAGLVYRLTESSFYVGLVISLGAVGWQWPQLFIGHLTEHRPRKMPTYVVTAFLRTAAVLGMAAVVYWWRWGGNGLFWAILLLFTLFSTAGGMCVVPFMDIVAKTIPRHHQPMLLAYRRFFGGLLGALAGGITVYILSERSGLGFPDNYGALFLLGAAVNVLAYASFMGVREPVEPVASRQVPFLTYLRRGPVLFRRDTEYRRYFYYRCGWALTIMSHALFVPFAVHRFDAPERMAGWFTAFIMFSGALTSLVFGKACQRYGELALLQLSTWVALIAPATALALALTHDHPALTAFVESNYLWAYLIMFTASATAVTGSQMASTVYLLALSPALIRPTYIAFMNTVTVPLLFAPTLGGFLAEVITYEGAFAISCAASVITLWIGGRLQPRGPESAPVVDFETSENV